MQRLYKEKPKTTMNAIKFRLLLGLLLINSCQPKDPEANLLLGAWKLVESKSVSGKDWQRTDPSLATNVIFWDYGLISTGENTLFSGGWCNKAERYTAKEGKITFTYGEPNCIPLIPPQIPAEARIVDITQQLLILEWGSQMLKFERPNA